MEEAKLVYRPGGSYELTPLGNYLVNPPREDVTQENIAGKISETMDILAETEQKVKQEMNEITLESHINGSKTHHPGLEKGFASTNSTDIHTYTWERAKSKVQEVLEKTEK